MAIGFTRLQRLLLVGLLALATFVLWSDQAFGWSERQPDAAVPAAAYRLRLAARTQEAKEFNPPPESFRFNPNTVTAAALIRLGLSERQAGSWLKFRGDRATAFYRPEDIGRLYALSEEDKNRLIPLAYVPDSGNTRYRKPSRAGFPFDPNSVSPAELERLGLSPKQALALVNYRAKAKYAPAFRKPADLARVRTMSEAQRAHLLEWARFPEQAPEQVAAAQRFRFNPNTIPADSFALLGFPDWQARSLVKYRGDRAVTFRRATDLRRVSALDSALVETVIALVDLPASPTFKAPAAAPATYGYAPKAPPPADGLDINTADTTAWKSLPGIGSYRARTIVRFREVLGGFASVAQVAETRRLPDSTYQQMLPYLRYRTPPRQLAINRVTYEALYAHPYINRNLANSLVRNREKFGRFNGPADLRRLRLMTPEKTARLLPYFSFE